MDDISENDNYPVTIADAETLSYLLRVLIHDLMNFIAVVRLNGDLAKTKPDRFSAAGLWNRLESSVKLIEKEISQARTINRRLLNPEELKPTRFCIASVTRSVLQVFSLRAQHKGITLTWRIPGESFMAVADELAVRQGIITAMLDNAVKFCRKDDRIFVNLESSGSTVTISVYDNGIGIPNAWIGEILTTPNREQIRRSGTEGETGIGFGLLTASLLAKRFGGELTVQNIMEENLKYNTVFSLTMPLESLQES